MQLAQVSSPSFGDGLWWSVILVVGSLCSLSKSQRGAVFAFSPALTKTLYPSSETSATTTVTVYVLELPLDVQQCAKRCEVAAQSSAAVAHEVSLRLS